MKPSSINILRRLIALSLARTGSPIERNLVRALDAPRGPKFETSRENHALLQSGLAILGTRWPFGLRMVERYVEALIEARVHDRMGFTSGIWALEPVNSMDKLRPEEMAIRLVRMAMLRKAFLMLGWRGYVMNRDFARVGFRLIEKRWRQVYATSKERD